MIPVYVTGGEITEKEKLAYIRRAKEQCEYLIVGVTTDDLCYERTKKYPVICQEDRVAIVESIRFVDRVVLQADMDKLTTVKEHQVDVVFVGSDWKGTTQWEQYEKVAKGFKSRAKTQPD